MPHSNSQAFVSQSHAPQPCREKNISIVKKAQLNPQQKSNFKNSSKHVILTWTVRERRHAAGALQLQTHAL